MTITPRYIPYGVIDLTFGDAGKGTTVDWLCSPASPLKTTRPRLVIRFNGGCQAGHNVHTRDGREHTFSMWGSGTFHGVPTWLSPQVFINPMNILNEARHLVEIGVPDPFALLWIDPECPVITPYHQIANQLRERERGLNRHGSCGHGFGEAVAIQRRHPAEHTLLADDLLNPVTVKDKLKIIRGWLLDEFGVGADRTAPALSHLVNYYNEFAAIMQNQIVYDYPLGHLENDRVVFEGAQGTLLDEFHGFHPHTTWSQCTSWGAKNLLINLGFSDDMMVLGIARAYMTRHGEGPFPTESKSLNDRLPEPDNCDVGFQGRFRRGYFDVPLLQYAKRCGPVHALVMTHMDRVDQYPPTVCTSYQWRHAQKYKFEPRVFSTEEEQIAHQERLTGMMRDVQPVFERLDTPHDPRSYAALVGLDLFASSYGPTWNDKAIGKIVD